MLERNSGGARDVLVVGNGEEGAQWCPQSHLQNANKKLLHQNTHSFPWGERFFKCKCLLTWFFFSKPPCKPLS